MFRRLRRSSSSSCCSCWRSWASSGSRSPPCRRRHRVRQRVSVTWAASRVSWWMTTWRKSWADSQSADRSSMASRAWSQRCWAASWAIRSAWSIHRLVRRFRAAALRMHRASSTASTSEGTIRNRFIRPPWPGRSRCPPGPGTGETPETGPSSAPASAAAAATRRPRPFSSYCPAAAARR